jgi:methylated-DNA-protein-cysteine methyltransferase-like protein
MPHHEPPTAKVRAALARHDLIYATVAAIPPGRVATYAQVARAAGLHRRARLVGFALHLLPEDTAIPWHRVVNARGTISPRGRPDLEREQRLLLEDEGVVFDTHDRIPLAQFQWDVARDD